MQTCRRSPFTLGLWGLAGVFRAGGKPLGYGPVSGSEFASVCDIAADAGIEWVDVATGYGGGQALKRLGYWIRNSGLSFQIALKIGRNYVDGHPTSVLDPIALKTEIDVAIDLLGVMPNAIMLKDPPTAFLRCENLTERLQEIDEVLCGKLLGIATHDLEFPLCTQTGKGRLLELEYNGLQWRRANALANAARDDGWTIWGMQPLAYGFLAERTSSDSFGGDDFRSRLSQGVKQGLTALSGNFHSNLTTFSGWSRAERAIAFCLCTNVVDSVVIGPKNREQICSALRAAELAQVPAFLETVRRVLKEAAT